MARSGGRPLLTGDRDARQLEVLAPRQVFVDSDFLTGEADARLQPIRVPDDIEARHPGTSRIRLEQRREDAHGSRLASAVGSEHCEYAARLNLQVETVQGDRRPQSA